MLDCGSETKPPTQPHGRSTAAALIAAREHCPAEAIDQKLLSICYGHPCASHPLFEALANIELNRDQVAVLLRNYDAHACVLRRLLLKAATLMPEPAVGLVLENVRNEYGNGDYSQNHQLQLCDVAWKAGVSQAAFTAAAIQPGIKRFIKEVSVFYNPRSALYKRMGNGRLKPAAVAAGAVTATELLAVKEFKVLQIAFARLGLAAHIWFNHVLIEEEHSDESLQLALHFVGDKLGLDSVLVGMNGVLDANVHLYDGLLAALS